MSIDKFGHTSHGKRKLNLLDEIERTEELHKFLHDDGNNKINTKTLNVCSAVSKEYVDKQLKDKIDALNKSLTFKLSELDLRAQGYVEEFRKNFNSEIIRLTVQSLVKSTSNQSNQSIV